MADAQSDAAGLSVQEARDRYLVPSWGAGYVDVDHEGFARLKPEPDSEASVRLTEVIDELRRRGFRSPFLLRFPQILAHRVQRLQQAFQAAIEEFEYPGSYQGVYPVKVNQQRVVLETLVDQSAKHRYGLEVGSKGELVLALTQELHPEALTVCNGFKDHDYIELALRAERVGRRVLLICETVGEVRDVVALAQEVAVRPRVGFRARLHSRGAGQWVESGGSHAKFGLTTLEVLEAIAILEEAGFGDDLRCLHFHVGSQINDILAIKEAVKEAARLYCHIKRRAPGLEILDMGGGLGVDYDGTSTASDWSSNYTLEDYCRDCVYNVRTTCEQEDIKPPMLVTESGRAVTAYGTMVVVSPLKIIGRSRELPVPTGREPCHQVEELQATLDDMGPDTWRDLVNDARSLHEEVIVGFKMGFVSLEDRAAGEALFSDVCRRALRCQDPKDDDPDEISSLMTTVAPMIVCNFSVFQSLPDTWAVRQVFPIMPLSRLREEHVMPYTLGDITCDSDGRIDDFLSEESTPRKTILLPSLDLDEPYQLGIFLVGAYQDTLGDFHNLFGSAGEVSVWIDADGGFRIANQNRGTTVSKALQLFGFERQELVSRIDDRIGADETPEALRFRDCFLRVLSSGTYLRR